MATSVPHGRKNDSLSTPEFLYKALDYEFGFGLDPCPLNPQPDFDGLQLHWDGQRVFCNPPWSNIQPWVSKALTSAALTVLLLPTRCEMPWFHALYIDRDTELRWFRKRVKYCGGPGALEASFIAVIRKLAPGHTERTISEGLNGPK